MLTWVAAHQELLTWLLVVPLVMLLLVLLRAASVNLMTTRSQDFTSIPPTQIHSIPLNSARKPQPTATSSS